MNRPPSLLRFLALVVALAACSDRTTPILQEDVLSTIDSGIVGPCMLPNITCNRVCVDPATDIYNCGGCGIPCGEGRVCVRGQCDNQCPTGQMRCGDRCVNPMTDRNHCGQCDRACATGLVCSQGSCTLECGPMYTSCNVTVPDAGVSRDASLPRDTGLPPGTRFCTDVRSDELNCGACGNACPLGHVCENNDCILRCAAGQTACEGRCFDLQTDRYHCGACDRACPGQQRCMAGQCTGDTCPAGTAMCGADCVDLNASASHCGMCGNACPAPQYCNAGRCRLDCAIGRTACMNRCVNLSNDTLNCGACGTRCPAGNLCVGGACAASCAPGQSNCAGVCVNTAVDPANCGACGVACGPGYACNAGLCAPIQGTDASGCGAPSVRCGAVCTDIRSDNNHCGRCGNVCSGDRICAGGQCALPCIAGQTRCGSACVNAQLDAMNCGACGNVCPASAAFCFRGACTANPPATRYMRTVAPAGTTYTPACMLPGVTTVLTGVDDSSVVAMLPFPFRYWATDMPANSTINVTSNGWIGLDGVPNASLSGTIPTTTTPNAVIAAHWIDLVNTGSQCIATTGTAPNRRWIVEWPNSRYFGGTAGNPTFEIVLHEGTNNIDLAYQNMPGSASATSGLENQTGTLGISACATATTYNCAMTAGTIVRFVPIP